MIGVDLGKVGSVESACPSWFIGGFLFLLVPLGPYFRWKLKGRARTLFGRGEKVFEGDACEC